MVQKKRQLLGQIFVENGKVSLYDLRIALDAHKFHGVQVGQALLSRGVISQDDLDAALRSQQDSGKNLE